MSSSKQLTIRLAVKNIGKTIYFTKRWCKVKSLVTAIKTRYKLADIDVNSRLLSIAIGKGEPSLDDLHYSHPSGIYCGKQRMESYYFFQRPSLDPPFFPSPKSVDEWVEIDKVDSQQLEKYLSSLEKLESLSRSKKRKRLDSVDIIDELVVTKSATVLLQSVML